MSKVTSLSASVAAVLRGSYLSYKSEGMRFFHTGNFKRAIAWFDTAIELNPDDFESFLWRSRCDVMLGDLATSLKDVEQAERIEPDHPMCLYMRAETLYQQGEFEQALQFFHRGDHLCPTMIQFQSGINKARDAIGRSIGNPATVKLNLKGDLSHFKIFKERTPRLSRSAVPRRPSTVQLESIKPVANEKTLDKLLQELYGDKKFFDKLKNESGKEVKYKRETTDLIDEGLLLLHRRADFWQQHSPNYSRKYERKMKHLMKCTEVSTEAMHDFLVAELEKIVRLRDEGKRYDSLRRAHRCLTLLKYTYKGKVPNRKAFIADLHCFVGAVHFDNDQLTRAQRHFEISFNMAEKHGFTECRERVLELQGKAFFKQGNFAQALKVWHMKLAMSEHDLPKAIVCQEISLAHLMLGNTDDADMFGCQSVFFAESSGNTTAILGSLLLAGRAHMCLGDFVAAKEKLVRAVRMARKANDAEMEAAIVEVLAELREEIDFPEGRTPEVSNYMIERCLDTLSLRSMERYQASKYNSTKAEKQQRRDSKSRNYRSAICLWKEKLELAQSPLESSMLCVDIGRACMEIDQCDEALEYGCKALAFAEQAGDDSVIFQALMVQGYAAMLTSDFARSRESFDRALQWCLGERNQHAEELVRDGLASLREVSADGLVAPHEEAGNNVPEQDAEDAKKVEPQ